MPMNEDEAAAFAKLSATVEEQAKQLANFATLLDAVDGKIDATNTALTGVSDDIANALKGIRGDVAKSSDDIGALADRVTEVENGGDPVALAVAADDVTNSRLSELERRAGITYTPAPVPADDVE